MNFPSASHSAPHWRGFTPMADFDELVVREGQGCWLTTTDGHRLLDGISSLWCNVHGHRHPKIDAAVIEQLGRVAHVTTLGMSGETTEILAQRLAQITPGDLAHTFFSSDGSSAVEAALKMAFQYWRQCSEPQPEKTQYLALGSAYHGDTTGAVSLGGIKYFHQLFAPILFSPLRGPVPCTYRLPAEVSSESACDFYTQQFDAILRQHHSTIAAVVMEPLVQGAAGMITHPVGLLANIRRLCDQYNVLMIVDEVATGFGRTGKLFACEHENVTPDILCVGKGLTGGYLPMAATIARPHVFDAFLAPATESRQFYHGHTFGGNPLAAAAAIASIDLIEETDLISTVDRKAKHLRDRLSVLGVHPNVGDIRGRGLMVGIEIVADKTTKATFDSADQVGRKICQAAVQRGVWIRPLSDVIVAMPPLVATDDELDILADAIIDSIRCSLPVTKTAPEALQCSSPSR
ncbi:L-Lysine-8-amino-7-oxononanoate aminotransferase [Rubripirellula lacrimiformis]|uniref:Adenosylmethionine-8-amino-7-oxononanoate aminotransferase n=1 Tax=Rubripirellula lacrimiformis TaxID=1930273 RepID=A0A517N8B0_9BACT|nr:adenosylmethionine--8-amino-7-oxononanoate transaminase [Rubripirellula lacrimiformis]QDT03377.1 L-Lysine-8-amino-7-oxononanoate aminotransferase [Rubripirellula lacrimiformis]